MDEASTIKGHALVFDQPALIFVHVPKTGGRFLRALMRANFPDSGAKILLNDLPPHSTIAEIVQDDRVKAFFGGSLDRVRACGVVRNPWERMWSLYKFFLGSAQKRLRNSKLGYPVKPGTSEIQDIETVNSMTDLGFNEWIMKAQAIMERRDARLRSQIQFLDPAESGVSVRLFRFEQLPSDRDSVELALMRPGLEHFKIDTSADYVDQYSPESIAVVREMFAADIERLGYEF